MSSRMAGTRKSKFNVIGLSAYSVTANNSAAQLINPSSAVRAGVYLVNSFSRDWSAAQRRYAICC